MFEKKKTAHHGGLGKHQITIFYAKKAEISQADPRKKR